MRTIELTAATRQFTDDPAFSTSGLTVADGEICGFLGLKNSFISYTTEATA